MEDVDMKLKTALRYRRFLWNMMKSADHSITLPEHCLTITKTHLRSMADPELDDLIETVDAGKFYSNDDVLRFMCRLIEERKKLANAISQAKEAIRCDIDAIIENNQFRQLAAKHIEEMLRYKTSRTTESAHMVRSDKKNRTISYRYDIVVERNEAFDRDLAENILRGITAEINTTTAAIDSILSNVEVDHVAVFNMRGSFKDAMKKFLSDEEGEHDD